MKKWSKKLLTVIMAFILVLSLAGCKKDNNTQTVTQPDSTPTEAPETTEAAKEEETQTVDEVYPAFDMQKRTIKVGIWWDMYYTSEHTDITDNPGLTNTETAQMMLDNVRRIEEKYNVRIEYVNLGWDGIMESINTSIMAGTPECDIYLADLQFGIPAVINGLAQDLTKIASPSSDMFHDQKVIKPLEALGGTYLFSEQGIPQSGIFLGYNGTMIQELGLEDPQKLYKEGKWTWDKFAELAKAGTRDTNGDGSVDVYGFGGVFIDFINGLNMNNGGSLAGNSTEGLSTKPVTESLEFVNRLYNVDQSARPWNGDDWNDNLFAWSDGKVMFWTAQGWSLKQEADAAVAEGAELPFDYHVVPYPSGPSGDGKAYSPVSGNWYFVPVGVKEPEKVLQVFEEYLNWHGGDSEYRDDPSWFESCFQTEEDLEMAYTTGVNLKLDPWNSLPSFDFGSNIWYPIVVDKDTTVAQAVESSKQVLQDSLDTFYGANKE
jgi:ABC-type glycerol-3-phosphate transport system substrate-binding protein